MGRGKWFTKEEIELIEDMRNKGYTVQYIAFKLGRSKQAVSNNARIRNVHNRWTESEKQKTYDLWKKGATYKEIASEVKRSEAAIKWRIAYDRKKAVGR